MRSVGLGLALLASVQFAVVPAFAADSAKPAVKTAANKTAKKKKRKAPVPESTTLQTTSGDVPTSSPSPAPAASPDSATPAPTSPAPASAAPASPASPAPDATPAPAPAAAAPASATPAGSVVVHINSPKTVSLEKRSSPSGAWEHVCNSPCDIATSTSDEYQVLGEELNSSVPFILDGSQGEKVTLDVTPGYHNSAARGGWVLAGGAALIVGGVVTLVAGSKSNYVPGDNGQGTSHNQNTDFIFAGSILLTAGVIAALGGGALMFDNAHTKVEGAIGAPQEKKNNDVKVQVTAQRLPQWREDSGPQLGQSRFVSVLSGSF